jgi:hypothetical protein
MLMSAILRSRQITAERRGQHTTGLGNAPSAASGLGDSSRILVDCPGSAPMRQKWRVEEGRISGPS